MPKYYGVYEAEVGDNVDPLSQNRLKVIVPLMPSAASNWARACVPYSGSGSIDVPAVGDKVWVLFEDGDADSPVWIGWSP
jgi:hypothetical protein